MASQVTQENRRNSFTRELISGWMSILTEPNLNTFLNQKDQVDPRKTFLGIGLFGLILSLWVFATQPIAPFIASDNALVIFLQVFIFTEAIFFIVNLVLFLIAKAFSGKGSFSQQSYLLSLVTVPLGTVLIALIFIRQKLGFTLTAVSNPFSPTGIVGIILLILVLYGFLLLLFAIQATHILRPKTALYILGAPLLTWGILRVVLMSVAGEENIITTEWSFIADQWFKGTAQELLIGHLWLVIFSVVIAVMMGVLIGVFITSPARRPRPAHLAVLIPLLIGLMLWAASSGLMSREIADPINQLVKGWDRSLTRVDNLFFSPLLDIIAAIISKPGAVGMIVAVFTIILYFLFLAGETASELTLYIAGIILTIPSVALFGVLIKPLGIGPFNAAFALILYAQLPILRNTYTGIKAVAPEIVEAGRGMGMSEFELLRKVKLPMAVPVILTGVRISVVMLIGIAAIAAYIGNDTLGEYIFAGISRAQEKRYIAGAFLVAVLALAVDYLLGWVQNVLTPEGLKGRRETS